MYRRPKFQEVLLEIRRQMACDADYDVDLFTEMVRTGAIVRRTEKPRTEPIERATNDSSVPDLTTAGEIKRK